ncbi:helix-turn-helix domain-containing protein [Nocardia arizonensis]|uniref:helix-turn-helix domain-containing protein n=1 Tax=Nocardia arizonensis TaxID=1141647 RepID=UPI0012E26817|nr:helix-turn-helix domain-containing protein [Nocardia arizonensis]
MRTAPVVLSELDARHSWTFVLSTPWRRVVDSVSGATRHMVPVDRFEWERIARRVQMHSTTKFLALMLATYADSDGTRIRPGVERLALVMCVSEKTVKRAFADLRALGLVERTKQGNRHRGLADEYRLTVPSTLLDHPMLDPNETAISGGQS